MKRGLSVPLTLMASALVAFSAIFGLLAITDTSEPVADMRIEPSQRFVTTNEIFEIELVIESRVPTNVFAGEIHFSKDLLAIKSIDYNTSIADLWAERPWFSNGAGTMNFAGGTTRNGGFVGSGTLVRVTFEAVAEGQGIISMHEPRILLYDGLGTDSVVENSVDAIFTIEQQPENILTQTHGGLYFKVGSHAPSTDLNGDGVQSLADVSIFMLNILKNDLRYDFNADEKVDLKDLNMLLSTK